VRNLIKVGLVAIVPFLGLAAPVVAGPFEDGLAAHKRGDYATTLRLWRPLADQGDAQAQFNLGVIYAKGQGVPQDYVEAMNWYRKAADQANAQAQFNLGVIYAKGQGVPQDYVEAMKWFHKAADQGDAQAQSNLGFMYAKGQGVPEDYVRAHMWFNLSAAHGNKVAAKNRDLLALSMTPAQKAEAQKLAREWKRK
jgi:TPR repeat protein